MSLFINTWYGRAGQHPLVLVINGSDTYGSLELVDWAPRLASVVKAVVMSPLDLKITKLFLVDDKGQTLLNQLEFRVHIGSLPSHRTIRLFRQHHHKCRKTRSFKSKVVQYLDCKIFPSLADQQRSQESLNLEQLLQLAQSIHF
jgi:hypothetical protein